MTSSSDDAAGFAIYREFIRFGIGSCTEVTVNGRRVPETPEQACVRRWRRLSEAVREQFVAEGRAEPGAQRDWK